MYNEVHAYCWDRLLRAVARGDSMSIPQRESLKEYIMNSSPDKKLVEAATRLVDGTLTDAAVIDGYRSSGAKNLDPVKFRESLAVNQTDVVMDRLNSLMDAANE